DKDYAVKAFYFDNKIVDSNENGDEWDEDEFFTQKGAPRTFGLTVSYDF
ncbi:MAG: hypothetical protein HKP62_08920, partial [Sulfurovum sp.]|nr:hypothetical protein [Sulfurovum sp.]